VQRWRNCWRWSGAKLFRREGHESIGAGVGRSFGWRTGDGGVRASGKLEIASTRAEDYVCIVEGVGVRRAWGRAICQEDSVDVNLRPVIMIVAIEEDLAASRDADVTQRDVAEGGRRVSLDWAVCGVGSGDIERAA